MCITIYNLRSLDAYNIPKPANNNYYRYGYRSVLGVFSYTWIYLFCVKKLNSNPRWRARQYFCPPIKYLGEAIVLAPLQWHAQKFPMGGDIIEGWSEN